MQQPEKKQMMIGRALCRADGLAGQLVRGFPRPQLERERRRGEETVAGQKEREEEEDRGGQSVVPAICSAVALGSLINTSTQSLCPSCSSLLASLTKRRPTVEG